MAACPLAGQEAADAGRCRPRLTTQGAGSPGRLSAGATEWASSGGGAAGFEGGGASSADSRAESSANWVHSSPTNASALASRFSHMNVLIIEGHLCEGV